MSENAATPSQAEDLVAQVDTGARAPTNWQGPFILIMCFVWAAYQIFIASNLPFTLGVLMGSNFFIIIKSEARFIHLAFAMFLAAMAFPLFKNSPRHHIPWYDWVLGLLAVCCCLYLLVFHESIAVRAGLPTTADLTFSAMGMVILAISVYRALGLPLVIVASVFVAYVFFGSSEYLPEAVQWKGASFNKAMWHFWMQTEGVFGVALNVSASLIFLFVVFGSILEKAGAGNFFIKIAFALLGHLRGGPAKAAVVASAMSGLYSGSSIANTVTTGTFTIPLMKRTGLSAEKAGAVEVASSTNGQLTPPVMGAAAFLISEFTGVSYQDIIIHALVPALVSYIALVYIVHLEAMKLNLQGLPKPPSTMTVKMKMIGFLGGFIGIAFLGMAVYYGLGWIKVVVPDAAFSVVVALSIAMYLILLWFAARKPDLVVDPPDAPITELPRAGATAITGLYYVLPIVILIWCITLERLSPALAAFWAVIAMITVALTQHPIKAFFRGTGDYMRVFRQGVDEWIDGMISGSRNMIGIGVATGAAGIIVGTIALTGAHQVVGEFVEFLAGGQLLVMLLLVAVMSLILGMGLPTTANYIVVSSLMAPVIVALGAKSGLIVPLIAVHLFVFYFGILADDTPPVGLAAFAAAAISGGDPIKTGLQGFAYDIRTALLPFLFLFNTELLLIDVGWAKGIFVFVIAVIAMMLFASATQGYLFVRNRIWESAILLLVAFTLFRPGYWLDKVSPPFVTHPGADIMKIVAAEPANGELRIRIEGPDVSSLDKTYGTSLIIPLGKKAGPEQRLEKIGLLVMVDDGKALLEEPLPGSPFEKLGNQVDFYGDNPVEIKAVMLPAERIWKEVFYLPALLLLGGVVLLQRRRRSSETVTT
ncbi:MAG: TRAP transporter permease [Rhodospirillaceae bacterium]|jgi:TRAP transporter 4TM/12TM fusion protein|nr:TRAP transporter permease [Rhodospirillaceae bacterium]MBT6429266.1 TRAP transporter permease [Rhodospirillaceae bacterium]